MRKINVRSPYYIEVNEVQKPTLYYALQKCSDSSTGYVSEQEVGDFSPTLENNDRVQDASLNDYTVVGRVDITQGTYTSVGLISDTGEIGCVIPPADLFYKLIKCTDPNSNTTYLSFQKTTDTTLEDGQRVEFGGDYYTISGEAEASEGTKIGYVNIIQGETGCPAVIPPIEPQTLQINCGDTVNVGNDVGVVTYQVNTPETGVFSVDISGSEVPAKFTLKWNGNEATTNYIGLDIYDQDLLDAGIPIGEIATGDPSTKASNSVQITKATQNPELVELIVNAPLVNDSYSLDFNCPVSPPVQIIPTTQINVWFDDSGSMSGTRPRLLDMVNNELKPCLLAYYNNDEAAYNKFVSVRDYGGPSYDNPDYWEYNERFPIVMAWEPDVEDATNCINLVFQDEVGGTYQFSGNANPSYISASWKYDIAEFKNVINNNETGYVTPVLFQIATYTYEYAFGRFLDFIEYGEGAYAPSEYNLKDMADKYIIKRDLIPSNPNPNYYRDKVIQVFNELGLNITCP
jgi:hypothetical protein